MKNLNLDIIVLVLINMVRRSMNFKLANSTISLIYLGLPFKSTSADLDETLSFKVDSDKVRSVEVH